jgi:serine O-acetyltransferase
MRLSLSRQELLDYTSAQLNAFFPDGRPVRLADFSGAFDTAIDRLAYCFSHVSLPRYGEASGTRMDHLYADHYMMYLWFLANTLWQEDVDGAVLNKLYYLNKVMHGLDCMFDTGLPDVFLIFHGSGTMLGKAEYGRFFVAFQGCTVGQHNWLYPVIGTGVALAAHSAVFGNSRIGDHVSIGSHTNVFQRDIPPGSAVYHNQEGKFTVVPQPKSLAGWFFHNINDTKPRMQTIA